MVNNDCTIKVKIAFICYQLTIIQQSIDDFWTLYVSVNLKHSTINVHCHIIQDGYEIKDYPNVKTVNYYIA